MSIVLAAIAFISLTTIAVIVKVRKMALTYMRGEISGFGIDYGKDYQERLKFADEWMNKNPEEELEILSEDGLKLKARWWDFNRKITVLYVHGYGNNGRQAALLAEFFQINLEANILAVDLRAHGLSEGEWIGFGWKDKKDILKWIQMLLEQKGKDQKVVLFGISMGAATVLSVCGEEMPDNVIMACADCAYSRLDEVFKNYIKHRLGLPVGMVFSIIRLCFRRYYGFSITEVQPILQVEKAKLPILFIHGEADTLIPAEMTHHMHQRCASPSEMVLFSDAGHAMSAICEWKKYQEAILIFYERARREKM